MSVSDFSMLFWAGKLRRTMMAPRYCGIVLLLLYEPFLVSVAYNIDTKFPVVLKNSIDGSNSYFGASVLLISGAEPSIIIGSPKSNSSLKSHEGIVEPGLIWQCSFLKRQEACRVLTLDPTGNVEDPSVENIWDRKDGGWLGGAIAANSKDFLACANRWSNQYYFQTGHKQRNVYYVNGICYRRPENDVHQYPFPNATSQLAKSRLLPIAKEHQEGNAWAYGQAGFSIHLPSKSDEVLLGAPGVQAWRGSVIQLSRNSPEQDTFPNMLVFNNTEDAPPKMQNDSYFGYATNSGKFFKSFAINENKVQYVAGAPRGRDLKGYVAVFNMPMESSEQVLFEAEGTQMGSYFGSSLCVADVNGDGWDDLLVGAPFQSTSIRGKPVLAKIMDDSVKNVKASQKVQGTGDEGAVFVYLNNNGTSFRQNPSVFPGRQAWSQYGTAISNLGDINKDGYTDVAVGAPYENDGVGSVYIFYGSDIGLTKRNFQLIEGKSITQGLKGFGYSLFSGKDIDQNGFNDLAVGAFDSGHVVVLRGRPVVTLVGSVRTDIKRLSFDIQEFEVKSCFHFFGPSNVQSLTINIRIESDILSPKKRVYLRKVHQDVVKTHLEYEETLPKDQERCTTFFATVKEALETTGKPVEIKITGVSIVEPVSSNEPTLYEIASSFGGQVRTIVSGPGFQAFCSACPMINPVSSTYKELLLPLALNCGDDDICVADLVISATFREAKQDNSFIIGSSSVLTMDLKIFNKGEPAVSPIVTLAWASIPPKKMPPECEKKEAISGIQCRLGKILESQQSRSIVLELNMGDIDAGSLDQLKIEVKASTGSEIKNPVALTKTYTVWLISSADIYLTASRYVTTFNLETLSPLISSHHMFEVKLDGPTSIPGAELDIKIPESIQYSTSRVTFDISEPTVSALYDTTINCFPVKGGFKKGRALGTKGKNSEAADEYNNIEEMEGDWDDVSSTPEYLDASNSTEEGEEDEVQLGGSMLKRSRGELLVDCDNAVKKLQVKCMIVRCRLSRMKSNGLAAITFPVRTNSASLKNIFTKERFSSIKIVSSGTVSISNVPVDIQPKSDKPDTAHSIVIIEEESAKPVSKLIYLLGILIGLLILGIIIYILHRYGLFKRKRNPALDKKAKANANGDATNEESVPLQDMHGDEPTEKEEEMR